MSRSTRSGIFSIDHPQMLPDPHTVTQMEAAAKRIADAATRNEKVAIFGDYDVDGATSAALLA